MDVTKSTITAADLANLANQNEPKNPDDEQDAGAGGGAFPPNTSTNRAGAGGGAFPPNTTTNRAGAGGGAFPPEANNVLQEDQVTLSDEAKKIEE